MVYPVQKGLPLRVRALVDYMSEQVRELLSRPCVCRNAPPKSGKNARGKKDA